MSFLFFKKLYKSYERQGIIFDAHQAFAELSEEVTTRNQDDFHIWLAAGYFEKRIAIASTAEDFENIKKVLSSKQALISYVCDIQAIETQSFQNEMRAELSVVKKQNEHLEKQNEDLAAIAKQSQQEVLAVRAEAKEDGKKAKRANFVYFALGAVISASLTFVPMMLTKSKEGAKKSEPQTTAPVSPETNIYLFDFGCPDKSNDKNKELPPANTQDKIPALVPRKIKVRMQSAAP
ncbi:MAG: hypothetical protein EOM37_05060 [Proteobacteria bacterium]|nr:hypothetical protein [Pseudomonadota bacterium]